MAQPTPYTRQTDFSTDEAGLVAGRSTVRTARVDAELDALGLTANETRVNLGIIQRDDTKLRDGAVELHTLSADVRALLATTSANPRGAWLTATTYAVGDLVTQSTNTYICAVAHTSGTFATDLTAVRWLLVALGATAAASSVPFTPTATLAATNVQAAIEEADTENRALSAAASAAVVTAAANLASTASGLGDALIAVKRTLTGSVATTAHDWIDAQADVNPVADFLALRDGSNQTAKVQLALDSLGSDGGLVEVPRGCKFNLQSLVFPMRSNINYFMDDDLSRPNPSTTLGTNERVLFMANANVDGIVNETRVTAPFHPGMNIDVRRDVPGHDAHLGPTQVRVPTSTTPARASYNIQDQQVETWRKLYEIFGGDYSNFSGMTEYTWYRTFTLTGVGTGAGGWVSTPAVGVLITGATSGAKGWFLSATSGATVVLWLSGRFVAGEALTDNNETSVNTLSAVLFEALAMQPMAQDLRKGNWSWGLPPGLGEELANVGGRLAIMPTRSFGQHVYKTITHPGIVVSDLVSDVPTNGYVVNYNTTPAAASRRLTLRGLASAVEGTQDLSNLGAVRANVQFNNSAVKSDSSFNVTSVTRTGTGVYEINIPAGVLIRLDPCVTFGTEAPLDYAVWDFASSTLTKLVVKNYTTGTSTPANLAGRLSVCVTGGDI